MTDYWEIIISIVLVITLTVIIFFLASKYLSKLGFDQKQGKIKSNPSLPLFFGAFFNIFIILIAFLIYKFVSNRDISSLGFLLSANDFIFCILILVGNYGLAWSFINNHGRLSIHKRQSKASISLSYSILLLTLFAAAFQEEVVFRGFIVSLLKSFGWIFVLFISTILFTLVHYITSKINIYNTINWVFGGLMLFTVYYLSGSIWVAAIVHTSRNLINSLLFLNIPQYSIVHLKTPLPEKKKSFYYSILSVGTIIFTLVWYTLLK